MVCDIPLESSWQGLQLCFRPHRNQWFAHEIVRPQSCESLSYENFGTKSYLDVAPVERRRVYYKVESGGFPQVWAMVSLVSPSCPWLVLTPKMFQLCINHLVLVLWSFVWVIEACQFFLVPSWNSNTPLYPSKVLQARERSSIPCFSTIFSLDSHLNPSRSWDCVS